MRMSVLLNIGLLILVLTAACNKEGGQREGKTTENTVSVTARIAGTKAVIGNNSSLQWRFNDAIDVITSEGRSVKFLSDEVKGSEATFSGKIFSDETITSGSYPSGCGSVKDGGLYLDYPVSHSWEENVVCPPMAAELSGEKILSFHEAGGRLCFSFSGIPGTAASFHVTAKGQRLTGTFPVIDGVVSTEEVEESEDIVVRFSAARSDMIFHIPVPCGNYRAITVWFEDASGSRLAWADGGQVTNPATVAQGQEVPLSGGTFEPSVGVMTYNILYYKPSSEESITGFKRWEFRKDNIVARIRDAAPAVFGTQENTGWQAQYILEQLPQYKVLGRNLYGTDYNTITSSNTSQMDYEIEAIYYNPQLLELVDGQWETFWLSNTPDTPRSKIEGVQYSRACTWAKFRRKGGSAVFYVFNSHLHANSGVLTGYDPEIIRKSEAEIVLKKIKEITGGNAPVIWIGDFNCKPTSSAIQFVLNNSYIGFVDSRPSSYSGRIGTFTNFSTATSYNSESYRYDFVFVNDKWNVMKHSVVDTDVLSGAWGSDHLPVAVTAVIK